MDNRYEGFNDYDHAYDTQNVLGDKVFQQAVARSSHGRRPKSSIMRAPTTATRLTTASARVNTAVSGLRRLTTATNTMMRSSLASRYGADAARPMTAVRAAGYTSAGTRGSSFDPMKAVVSEKPPDESNEEKCRQMEKKVNDLLKESILAWEKGEMKQALEKAKEAGRRERAAVKMREQLSVVDQLNLDLTFTVLFNLAHQYMANDLLTEALNTYQVIVKNKMFTNSGRLKVNIGNIYFKKKDYKKAIKYYRMALDQVPNVQKDTRIKILNNIGVAFIKCGEYDEASSTFEHCLEEKGDYGTALNLILTAYCLEDVDKMKDAFQRLVDIPLLFDDEPKYMEQQDFLLAQVISNDSLKQWERQRRQTAERTILTAAKIISSAIAATYAEGYAWCVEAIKQSVYSPLAMELEMNKAVELLRQGDLMAAQQVLLVFNNKESKVASAAANNLALLNLLQGPSKIDDAIQYCEQSLSVDRYNSNALVNRGNIFFVVGDYEKAFQCYKEALNNEASCVQALYNMGYVCRLQGKMEAALDCFYKLHSILLNNVEVLCQLAAIYESLEDTAQAIELYSQANSLAPTDPAILSKLANIYDAEGDKSQAFQCHYDSYRYFPSNIGVIEWLGAYYIDAQFPEKAVNYFEKASIMEPNEIKWQLMMASCQRRSGNYQKALDLYRQIHRRFPENIECLKFLVRICTDLGMPEAKEFMEKLSKAEKVRQLRMQRESDSSQGKRSSAASAQSLPPQTSQGRPSSRSSLRTSSARFVFDNNEQYQVTQRKMNSADYSYKDPLGPAPARPKTGSHRREANFDESFENEQLDDSLLPE
ncbi:Intraflagellar transport protein 88 -like protein [Toxocara canis]|uniref:Intraflagellar transport protein 88-like protein n=1 Tax=Toxocara canis TaxID=6265 RepID=A0A0B2VT67_TOXCA|nr:Intraflagellar transport protein 88 -like protein [Toxocara canis]